MIPFSSPSRSSSGNAFVYILVACVLLGLLTYSVTRSYNAGGAAKDLDDTKGTIAADSIQAYAGSTANVITQLDQTGVSIDEINFILPSDAAFNTGSTTEKLFHPDGGGLNYKPLPAGTIDTSLVTDPLPGYYVGLFNNVDWTSTTAHDLLFVAYGLTETACIALNRRLNGSAVIPELQSSMAATLVDAYHHSGGNVDLIDSNCPLCDEKAAQCITDGSDHYAFYSILIAR